MISTTFILIGSLCTFIWGVAHLFPTKSVVNNFGQISADNRLIITMEWIMEGVFLIFIGLLCAGLCLFYASDAASVFVYVFSAIFLFIMAVISLFTGYKINFLPFKLCPAIFSLSALLLLAGTLAF